MPFDLMLIAEINYIQNIFPLFSNTFKNDKINRLNL